MDSKMNAYPEAPDAWFNQRIKNDGGIFDRASFDLMMQPVKNHRVAVDVGAHCGSWTVALSERFEKVHAFEPFEKNFKYLHKNAGHLQNVTLYRAALGCANFYASMVDGRENSGQSHITGVFDSPSLDASVSVSPLDDYGLTRVDLLKIDAEGYELPVLQGARDTILKCSPVILVELNGLAARYGLTDEGVKSYLSGLGYVLFGSQNKDHVYVKNWGLRPV